MQSVANNCQEKAGCLYIYRLKQAAYYCLRTVTLGG